MLNIVQSQLATDLNCAPDDLNGEKDSFVFTETQDNPDRRPFPRSEQHFEMLSMGNSIVVSASPDILAIVKPLLDGKSRDEAFSMPFIYGHSLYYRIWKIRISQSRIHRFGRVYGIENLRMGLIHEIIEYSKRTLFDALR